MKSNPRLVAVEKQLQREFDLDYFEAELVADDLLANLETLELDVLRGFKAGDLAEMREAAQALERVAGNIGLAELRKFSSDLMQAIANGDKRVEEITLGLHNFLSELGCNAAAGPSPT